MAKDYYTGVDIMAQGKRPDYRVYVTRENNGKTYYNAIGAAWKVGNDGVSIKLDALPVNGEMVLFPPREDDGAD